MHQSGSALGKDGEWVMHIGFIFSSTPGYVVRLLNPTLTRHLLLLLVPTIIHVGCIESQTTTM